MIMIVEIIISIVMLFICICVVYHYFIRQIEELEIRILILEKRIEEYKHSLKNINGFVIPIKDIEKYDVNKVIEWLSRLKVTEKKNRKKVKNK